MNTMRRGGRLALLTLALLLTGQGRAPRRPATDGPGEAVARPAEPEGNGTPGRFLAGRRP